MEDVLGFFAADLRTWFTNTWDIEVRKEPLPRLGPMQLLARKKGSCDDISVLEVYTLRSQGYPAAVDQVPFWATSSGTHFFNNTLDEKLKPVPFDVSTAEVKISDFSREPSKVIRETFSKQPGALASFYPAANIPEGFMRRQNYVDVTAEHWETSDMTCRVGGNAKTPPIAFACVFNAGTWRATWWGKVDKGAVTFSKMCKGAVFLPAYFTGTKLVPAGYPVASGYKETLVLKPDTLSKRTVTVQWQEKYLVYRPGKSYKLYYWNNGWRLAGEKKAGEFTTELAFDDVPANALLLLRPEYSEGKERPFTISSAGERTWW
jgi:hypothetical protein